MSRTTRTTFYIRLGDRCSGEWCDYVWFFDRVLMKLHLTRDKDYYFETRKSFPNPKYLCNELRSSVK